MISTQPTTICIVTYPAEARLTSLQLEAGNETLTVSSVAVHRGKKFHACGGGGYFEKLIVLAKRAFTTKSANEKWLIVNRSLQNHGNFVICRILAISSWACDIDQEKYHKKRMSCHEIGY